MVGDAREAIAREVIFEQPRHLAEVAIVPDAGQHRGGLDLRLLRVQLPDVEIHDEGSGVVLVPVLEGTLHETMWELPIVIAPGDREVPAQHARRRHRELPQLALAEAEAM